MDKSNTSQQSALIPSTVNPELHSLMRSKASRLSSLQPLLSTREAVPGIFCAPWVVPVKGEYEYCPTGTDNTITALQHKAQKLEEATYI